MTLNNCCACALVWPNHLQTQIGSVNVENKQLIEMNMV